MTAVETLELLSKQWCSLQDLMKLTSLDRNSALKIRKEFLVSYLFNNKNSTTPTFYELFDNALDGISNDNIDIFSVRTGSKEKIKLFSPISQYIIESNKKNDFAKAIIDKLVEFSFDEVFDEKYDFFATIFEYLIKDYNEDLDNKKEDDLVL